MASAKSKLSFLFLLAILRTAICLAQAPKAAECVSASFAAELKVHDNFEQDVGNGLVFRLRPGKEPGWFIDVVPAKSPNSDYVYPVKPPLRFNSTQMLASGYSEDLKASFSHPHTMFFLLDSSDYEHVSSFVENVLWPSKTADPDRVMRAYFDAVAAAKTGWLQVKVPSAEYNVKNELKSAKVAVQVVVPRDFKVANKLKTQPADCPAKRNYQ